MSNHQEKSVHHFRTSNQVSASDLDQQYFWRLLHDQVAWVYQQPWLMVFV